MKLIVILFGVFFLNPCTQADLIKLRTDEWCPYACKPKTDKPGFMIEIAIEVFKKHNHEIDYEIMGWSRALAEVRSGLFDAVVGASKVDVKGFVLPQFPSGILKSYYWVQSSSPWYYENSVSLKNMKIGVINDYSYGDEIDKLINKNHPSFIKVSGEDPLLRLIQMTEAKRINGFVENPLVLKEFLNSLNKDISTFKIASKNLANDSDLFIAFSPKNPKSKIYAKILDEGIKEMRKSGRLKVILAKYGVEDWSH